MPSPSPPHLCLQVRGHQSFPFNQQPAKLQYSHLAACVRANLLPSSSTAGQPSKSRIPVSLSMTACSEASTACIKSLFEAGVQELSSRDWKKLNESSTKGCLSFEDGHALAVGGSMAALRAAVAGDASGLQLAWAEKGDLPNAKTCKTLDWCRGQLLQALSICAPARRVSQVMRFGGDCAAWDGLLD